MLPQTSPSHPEEGPPIKTDRGQSRSPATPPRLSGFIWLVSARNQSRRRSRTEDLEALVLKLMTLYKEIYTARFQLTIDLNDSLISNSVGQFIKLILAVYKPTDIEIGAHNVDRIVRAYMLSKT